MVPPKLLGALSYRICRARRHSCGASPDLYFVPGYAFGGIPVVILLRDFMQLAPLARGGRKSLLKEPMPPPVKTGKTKRCREVSTTGFQAELNGYRVFWDCLTHVLFLHGTHRFVDKSKSPPEPCPVFSQSCHSKPALGLFEHMRDPGGKKIPMHLRRALQDM